MAYKDNLIKQKMKSLTKHFDKASRILEDCKRHLILTVSLNQEIVNEYEMRVVTHRSLIFPSEIRPNREKGLPSQGLSEKRHPILPRSKVVSSINRLLYLH